MNIVDAVRQILPSWYNWLPVSLYLLFVVLLVGISMQVGLVIALQPFRKHKPEHWADRARFLYPARLLAASSPFWLALLITIPSYVFVTPLHPLPAWLYLTLVFFASYGFGFFLFHRFDKSIRNPNITLMQRFKFTLSFIVVMYPHLLIAILLGLFLMTREQSAQWYGFLAWGIGAMLVSISGASLWLLRWFGALTPAPEHLRNLVSQASQKTNVHPHSVWVMSSTMSNAFALPFAHQLLFTQPMLEQLDEGELESITAHELSHLSESWRVRWVRMGLGLMYGLWFMVVPYWAWWQEYGLILLSALAMFILALVGNSVFRSMEVQADEAGQEQEEEEGVYATALEKIYEYNLMPAVTGKKSIHPDLYDRMTNAGVVPGFEKPEPPVYRRMWVARIVGIALCFGGIVGFYSFFAAALPKNDTVQVMALSFNQRVDVPLRRLSWSARKKKNFSHALVFSQASMELSGYRSYNIYSHLWLLLRIKQCSSAKKLWREHSIQLFKWMQKYRWQRSFVYMRKRISNCKP